MAQIKNGLSRARGGVLALAVTAVLALQMFVASVASAAVEFAPKDVVEPVETQLAIALPLIVGIITVMIIFALTVALVRRHVGKGR
jgi:hypothetical protein